MRAGILVAAAALCLLPLTALGQRAAAPSVPVPIGVANVGPATGPVSRLPAERVEAIEVAITNLMAGVGIPGLSVAAAHDGQLVFASGYGFADLENFVPARADTAYRLASISKAMTAAVALRLAERGELDLDAPVRPHCPAFPEKRWAVTPRQLLSHRGGVRHLRGCAIEGVTGRPCEEVLHELVFAPAGMRRSRTDDVHALIPNRARGYVRAHPGILTNAALADMSFKVPGGGLSSTAPDVARFGQALLSGCLLTTQSLEEMLTPAGPDDGTSNGYGLGMTVGERDGRPEAWHGGGQEGVSTLLYLRPDGGPVVALLTNLQGVPRDPRLDLARRIADLVAADPDDAE